MKYSFYLLGFLFLFACSNATAPTNNSQEVTSQATAVKDYKNINQEEFKTLRKQPGVFILDVRTPLEANKGKISGAIEIDFRSAGFKEKINTLPKDKEYLVYCQSGGRSSKTAKMMMEMGFSKVYNLLGGYGDWQE